MRYLVRDKIFAIGDDYWIEDEHGRQAFLVDGKALRLRDTLEMKDPAGRVVVTLRAKVLSLRGAMTVERDGATLATVRRKRLSLLRNHYVVSLAGDAELDVSGRVLDREFEVARGGEVLARISRKWLRVRDTYAVDVVREDPADAALLIAVAVCVVRMAEKD
ncbi:LURP-one-related/scramblase family protein [Streptomyces sp. NPDC015131]|uniref:LURP-one-related/scramblase family protein n=1 Tax=Streptomyces sp. NPDC015131 TaxID=3364941 RepID=UPI0036FBC060